MVVFVYGIPVLTSLSWHWNPARGNRPEIAGLLLSVCVVEQCSVERTNYIIVSARDMSDKATHFLMRSGALFLDMIMEISSSLICVPMQFATRLMYPMVRHTICQCQQLTAFSSIL